MNGFDIWDLEIHQQDAYFENGKFESKNYLTVAAKTLVLGFTQTLYHNCNVTDKNKCKSANFKHKRQCAYLS